MSNELIHIENPNGNAQVAQAMHDAVVVREREIKAEYEKIAEKLTPFSFNETKEDWTRLKKMDDELKALIERTEASALSYAKADALLAQLAATRKNLAALYKENWAKFTALRDADKPAAPKREFLLEVYMTDADFMKIVKSLDKSGAKYRWVEVRAKDSQPKVDAMFANIQDSNAN